QLVLIQTPAYLCPSPMSAHGYVGSAANVAEDREGSLPTSEPQRLVFPDPLGRLIPGLGFGLDRLRVGVAPRSEQPQAEDDRPNGPDKGEVPAAGRDPAGQQRDAEAGEEQAGHKGNRVERVP